ncbi:hypothetical protein [Pseudomonas arsenicoxydans]|uniref:Uncharacterized protein n=1 Tax=Pseudomonas arsenicoxydans TaxID=702115 RepID=A0A4P6G1U8_9PSED|nr:hypothetical protein [Pseudomonas arsenicoxydans]QAY84026.1 hypothetical protein CUN61_08515 [Pseudomonas arsenicoxydans]
MQAGLVEAGSSLLRTNLASALDAGDRVALAQLDMTTLLKVFDYDLDDVSHISKVISYWAKHPKASEYYALNGLIYSLAEVVSATSDAGLAMGIRSVYENTGKAPWLGHV